MGIIIRYQFENVQSMGIQCVQPTNYVLTYLKLAEDYAVFVHKCEQRTSQDWGLLLSSNHRPTCVYFGWKVCALLLYL